MIRKEIATRSATTPRSPFHGRGRAARADHVSFLRCIRVSGSGVGLPTHHTLSAVGLSISHGCFIVRAVFPEVPVERHRRREIVQADQNFWIPGSGCRFDGWNPASRPSSTVNSRIVGFGGTFGHAPRLRRAL